MYAISHLKIAKFNGMSASSNWPSKQYTNYSHNLVGDAFAEHIHGVSPAFTVYGIIVSITLLAKSSAMQICTTMIANPHE